MLCSFNSRATAINKPSFQSKWMRMEKVPIIILLKYTPVVLFTAVTFHSLMLNSLEKGQTLTQRLHALKNETRSLK